MKAFLRAVLLSLRYKWSIIGAVICATLIAGLMVASISTVFPVVKVVLEGHTAHTWVESELEASDKEIESLQSDLVTFEDQAKVESNETVKRNLENKIALHKTRIEAEQQHQQNYIKIQPYIEKYAPDTPFETLVVAMIWLLVTTVLKGCLLVLSTVLVARAARKTVMDLRQI